MTKPSATKTTIRRSTPVITNLTKLIGIIFAVNELLIRSQPRPTGLAIAAFCMAGAQVSEEVISSILHNFLGNPPSEDK